MNVNDILKWSKNSESLTLDEFQMKYMETNSSADVYDEDGKLLFTFLPYTVLSSPQDGLIIKNISVDSFQGNKLVYKIECEAPCYVRNNMRVNNYKYVTPEYKYITDDIGLWYVLHDVPSLLEAYELHSKHIEKVIFNPPATILFWGDGTKTVVKDDRFREFDPEKGILYAILKKIAPNKKRYNEYLRLIDKEVES